MACAVRPSTTSAVLRYLPLPILLISLLPVALTLLATAQETSPAKPANSANRTLTLVPYRDPWKEARPRWLDIANGRLHQFIKNFNTPAGFYYRAGQVTLSYDPQQSGGVFRGHLAARGLKPNFAYQIKLCGKPVFGRGGWGKQGDDEGNARLGLAGRWWDDTVQKNGWDEYYRSLYIKAPLERRHTMVGYLFAGDFVTDEQGNADTDFAIEKPLHITWQDDQYTSLKNYVAGTWTVQSTKPPFIGYGSAQSPRGVRLWYEHEKGRPTRVNLPAGHYNCRLLITEESFHSNITAGGKWLTVLATEDFQNGRPDPDLANDLVFEMRADPSPEIPSKAAPLP